jgi:hypothetical protein
MVRALLLATTLLLSACMANAPAAQDVPALIVNASPQTQAEIRNVISQALNGAPITLAADALTRESSISIERTPVRDARGLLVNGRDPGRPEIFELVRNGRQCVLVQKRTGTRTVLRVAQCAHSAASSTG